MAAKEMYKNFNVAAKQENYFQEKGRNRIQEVLFTKYDEHDCVRDKQMFFKTVILWYGMLCQAMLSYAMVWKIWYAMRFQCYAMVYVVKDKHSATVPTGICLGGA